MKSRKNRMLGPNTRFKLQVSWQGEHWIWTGSSKGNPHYGVLRVNGVDVKAHRFSYQNFVGELKDTDFVCHTCDIPLCVNPKHLFIGTNVDNMRDMIEKGRSNKGEDRPAAKLSDDDIRYIRKHFKRGCPINGGLPLAKKFGVHRNIIGNIVNMTTWKHVI